MGVYKVTADIGLGKPWVTYSPGNDGEPDYYRDVYQDDHLIYCHGETCEVIEEREASVTLWNENFAVKKVFTIPRAQFDADFVKHTN